MNHKVRVGTSYIFYANLLEHRDLNGRVGTVVEFYGAPKANTVRHAYFQVKGERFRLVSTNSLYKMSERQLVIDALKADAEERLEELQHDWDVESTEGRYGQ